MKRMFRNSIEVGRPDDLHVVKGTIRAVAAQEDHFVEYWFEIDPTREQEPSWQLMVVGTGHPVPGNDWKWMGTTNRTPNGFVWHLYGKLVTDPLTH